MNTMKASTVVVMGFISLALLMGCSRSSKQDVKDAVSDVQTAAREEWLKFKSESEANIEANNKIVAEYKAKMTTADGKLQAKYDKKIDALEAKNKELKAKLDEYKDDGKTTWEQFKSEFNRDMNELGKALKDFTIDNKK